MPATAFKQEGINGVVIPFATLAIATIAIALRVVDTWPALPHQVAAFVSFLHICGVSPAVAGVVAVVLFLAGVVSGLSGFAFSAVAACVLWLLPPLQAVPLIMLLSVCNQLVSVGALRKQMALC